MANGKHVDQTERLRWVAEVFGNSYNGIVVTNKDAVILEVNPTFTDITGYSREDVVGMNPRILHSGQHDPSFYQSMWQALKIDGAWQGEIVNRRKDGEIIVELLSINSVHDEHGQTTHYVGTFSNLTRFRAYQNQLELMAHYDALTALPNRVLLADRIRQAIAWVERQGSLIAICYLDLNGFKPINDSYGHQTGDRVLIEVAERLKRSVREGDTVARVGGDEFVLLLNDVDSVQEVGVILDRLLVTVAEPLEAIPSRRITASVSVSLYPIDDCDPDQLLVHADKAMYVAKQSGSPGYHVFDPGRDLLMRSYREGVVTLRQALNGNQFELYYQPIVDLIDGQTVGIEALIRWNHPERGHLMPEEFLSGSRSGLENSVLSIEVDLWTIEMALKQMARWAQQGISAQVGVNISLPLLHWPEFGSRLAELLSAHPLTNDLRLEFEIGESTALADLVLTNRAIEECRHHNVNFVLDGFGTGYSSLMCLKRLPAEALKIDPTFVANMLSDPGDMSVVESIVALGRAFHRRVAAAGVETAVQAQALLARGCSIVQGHAIAAPMPGDEIPSWLTGFQPGHLLAANPPVE